MLILVLVDIETLKILKYSPPPPKKKTTYRGGMNGDGGKDWSSIVQSPEV